MARKEKRLRPHPQTRGFEGTEPGGSGVAIAVDSLDAIGLVGDSGATAMHDTAGGPSLPVKGF